MEIKKAIIKMLNTGEFDKIEKAVKGYREKRKVREIKRIFSKFKDNPETLESVSLALIIHAINSAAVWQTIAIYAAQD